MSAVTSQLPAIVITGSSSPYTARIQPSKEDRMHFLLSKHPRLLFRNVSSPSNSGSSSPTSSTSSSDLSASSIDALLAAELESPACPDATKSWIKSALGMEADTGTDAGDVDVRELCVEASPADSTDSFQSLMSAVSGMFGETEPLEVGPTSMDGRWPYIFKHGDFAFAKGGNGQWRRVIVRGSEFDDRLKCLSYMAEWITPEGCPCRGTFYPTLGEIKPDCLHVRELLEKENIELQEAGRDVEQKDLKAML